MTDLTLSYSEANTYLRCPRKYKHRAIDGIQKAKWHVAPIYRGSHFHELVKLWALGEDYVQYHLHTTAAVEQDEDFPLEIREERLELLELTWLMFLNWRDEYADDEIEILNVEEEFVLTLNDGTVLTCTPDLVFRRDGVLTVRDYKTVGSLPTEFPFGDIQSLFNTMAVSAAYDEEASFEFDYVRAKLPTEPRLNKTGPPKVNNLNRVDTTYEILRDFLSAEAPELLTDPEHKERLADLRDNNRFFKRITLWTDRAQITRTLQMLTELAEDIRVHYELNFWPQRFVPYGLGSCGSCEFKDLCEAEFYGYNVQQVLDERYEPRDEKNPYDEEVTE